jgi:hypothetical protein
MEADDQKGSKNQLLYNCEVSGFVKPDVQSSILTTTASTETNKLTLKDSVVLWSASNDYSWNRVRAAYIVASI